MTKIKRTRNILKVELLLLGALLIYLINYVLGKQTNVSLAQSWLDAHHELLAQQFSLVGT